MHDPRAKPVSVPAPALICVDPVRRTGDVMRTRTALAECAPLPLSFQPETTDKSPRVLEGAACSKPIVVVLPSVVGVRDMRVSGYVARASPTAAERCPIGRASQAKASGELPRFRERPP